MLVLVHAKLVTETKSLLFIHILYSEITNKLLIFSTLLYLMITNQL